MRASQGSSALHTLQWKILNQLFVKIGDGDWRIHKDRFMLLCDYPCHRYFAAWIFAFANEAQKTLMRRCYPEVAILSLVYRYNCGFRSSLCFQPWELLGSPGESATVAIEDVAQPFGNDGSEKWHLKVYKIAIPRHFVGRPLREIEFDTECGMFLFALESDDGVSTHLEPQVKLAPQSFAWVSFVKYPVLQSIKRFLDEDPLGLQLDCRRLTVLPYRLADNLKLSGYECSELQSEYGMRMIGMHNTNCDSIDFCDPEVLLEETSVIYVLESDYRKLERVAP